MNNRTPEAPIKGNILVVDDTPANLRLLSGMLAVRKLLAADPANLF